MSGNAQIFKSISLPKLATNDFDLTHDVKQTGKMGELIPCLALPCVPGDRHKLSCDILLRFQPMIAPIMHRVDVTMHYFFVPNRILWENWEDWIVNSNPLPDFPQIAIDAATTTAQERFMDYFGIPPFSQYTGGTTTNISALPFAAYQCIYNEYYRDQNLISEVPYQLNDGINSKLNLCQMRLRAWEHDYFTASLPFAQKGAAVDLPLGSVLLDPSWSGTPVFKDSGGAVSAGPLTNGVGGVDVGGLGPNAYDPDGSLVVGATTINDFRRAEKLQQWLELNARGGTRYIENILVHFRVRSSDKRLQRPEYITGSKSPVIVSEVLNTTGEVGGNPQGTMAGHGISVGKGYQGSYYCEEHGYIIGIMSVMPKSAYMDGIPKDFLKSDPFDMYWPSFANIGEQEVVQSEVYPYEVNGTSTVFGYVPRYAEYKYMPSRVAGDFRTTLDFWHLARKFSSVPQLNQEFIECNPTDLDRIFAVQDDSDNLVMHILHVIKSRRPMPVFGTPHL